jgi:hypothetical protein
MYVCQMSFASFYSDGCYVIAVNVAYASTNMTLDFSVMRVCLAFISKTELCYIKILYHASFMLYLAGPDFIHPNSWVCNTYREERHIEDFVART